MSTCTPTKWSSHFYNKIHGLWKTYRMLVVAFELSNGQRLALRSFQGLPLRTELAHQPDKYLRVYDLSNRVVYRNTKPSLDAIRLDVDHGKAAQVDIRFDPRLKALGCQPFDKYIPFKVMVSNVNLHPYTTAYSTYWTRSSSTPSTIG